MTFVAEAKSKTFSINERICSTECVILVTKDIACRLKNVILQKKKYVLIIKNNRCIYDYIYQSYLLLLMAGLKPKVIKMLVDCSSSKLSMRTRISEKLFPDKVLSGANEFDTMLRTWRGEQFD